ncbi:hypothetical protein PVK06_022304 [Gossypium arboreum]|uniref:Uncharacterized protein n=1 Tax=Gossypium arboreum TaxID=29729 RepID=A0ABR0P806_GOSAR|nr:hypothetical protein PVK06_022304 [Gossypium arboreum]
MGTLLPAKGSKWARERETPIHAIKECPTARGTLIYGGIDDRLVRNEFERCGSLIYGGIDDILIGLKLL